MQWYKSYSETLKVRQNMKNIFEKFERPNVTTSVAFEKLIRKVAKSIPETFFAYKRQLCSQRVFALVGINSAC